MGVLYPQPAIPLSLIVLLHAMNCAHLHAIAQDFTYVCPTELTAFNDRLAEFEAIGATVLGISTDTCETHLAWTRVPRSAGGLGPMNMPLIADTNKEIAQDYGVG